MAVFVWASGGLKCEGVHLPNFMQVQLFFASFNLCIFESQIKHKILRQVFTLSITLMLEDLSERVHRIDKA